MLQPTKAAEEITGHNVTKASANEGPRLLIGSWHLTRKAPGADAGYAFSVYETTITPGQRPSAA